MSADNPGGWPYPERQGVPLNPSRRWAHWVQDAGRLMPPQLLIWTRHRWELLDGQEADVRRHDHYIGPALTPAEHAAALAAARAEGAREMRERATAALKKRLSRLDKAADNTKGTEYGRTEAARQADVVRRDIRAIAALEAAP